MIIGIAGGSGSGKTTLTRRLAEALGSHSCLVLAQDSYYIDQSHRFDGDGGAVNFDHPSSIDFELMSSHLEQLRSGRSVEVPIYDFASHTRRPETECLHPASITLIEGTLLLSQSVIRAQLDLALFVSAPEAIRFERRLRRDTQERGRTPDGVRRQFLLQVKPMHDQFVEPSIEHSHLRIDGTSDLDCAVESILQRLRSSADS